MKYLNSFSEKYNIPGWNQDPKVRFYKNGSQFSTGKFSDIEDHLKQYDDITFSIDGIEKEFKNMKEYKNYMKSRDFDEIASTSLFASAAEAKKRLDKKKKNKKLNESTDIFDLEFAMTKIKEHFNEDKVTERLDDEILNWVDSDWEDECESEYDWYGDYGNHEAEDVVINDMIGWYKENYLKDLSSDDEVSLFHAIEEEYDCLR